MLRPLAVSIGEPGGIGADISLRAWHERERRKLPPFYIVGNLDHIKERAQLLGLQTPVEATGPDDVHACFDDAFPVVEIDAQFVDEPGNLVAENSGLVVRSIETAVSQVMQGEARGLVTNPIHKSALYAADFSYPGHTEFLAALAQKHTGQSCHPVMMLAGPELRAVPLTIHIPLADVPDAVTQEKIIRTVTIMARDLKQRFQIDQPRIAVCGLNPHAGEDGTIGTEDRDVIGPAITKLKADGFDVSGPIAADSLFRKEARRGFDAALAMYHDQALIPVKTLDFDRTVNVTLGLPFVRTSPDHGTALDLAGTGKASAESFIAALQLADQMARTSDRDRSAHDTR